MEEPNMRVLGIFLTIALSLLAIRAVAADACGVSACDPAGCGSADKCAQCGCECCCLKRTCQLECGKEKVKKYCWEVKCEEFCPLLPGRRCDDCKACDGNGDKSPNACRGGEKCPNPPIHTPRCGNARVKKILVKKEYECEQPKYKCVVQYLCPACAAGCNGTAVPPPAVDDKPQAPTPAPPAKTTLAIPLPPVIGTTLVTK